MSIVNASDVPKHSWDTIIIGAGPKGLAMKLKLEKAGVDACVLEKHGRAGNTWSPEFMDPSMAITTKVEITEEKEFTFENWYKNLSEADLSRYSSSFNMMSPKHYYDYIRDFAKRVSDVFYNTSVDNINIEADGLIKVFCSDGSTLYCKHLVIATGLAGYGSQEFSRNNLYSKLVKERLVTYTPDQVRTREDYLDFIGDAEELALVGSGMSQVTTMLVLPLLKTVKKIHFLSARSFDDRSPQLSLQYNQKYGDTIRGLYEDSRIVKYPFSNIKNMSCYSGKVSLDVEVSGQRETLNIDKVIFATGYSYKCTELPFLSPILSNLETERVGDEIFPKMDPNNRAYLNGKPSEIYFLGAATAQNCLERRQLHTTVKDVNTILEGLLGRTIEPI